MAQTWRAEGGKIMVPGQIGPDGTPLLGGPGSSEIALDLDDAIKLAEGRVAGAPNPLPSHVKLKARVQGLLRRS